MASNKAFRRSTETYLASWKEKPNRKPLILRGARQVGKTTLVEKFAENYAHSILLNLEKKADRNFFEKYEEVSVLVDALFLSRNIPKKERSNTLLFLDEIQESPRAIQMLRYFYEEIPDLAVISAGSLLEFAMRKVKSFPVGRVEYLYLHPLNFSEYLESMEHDSSIDALNTIPIPSFAHETLLDLFNSYAIIGGMPEIIRNYKEQESLLDLAIIYESIWATYKDDVQKYASNETERKVIKHIIDSAPYYLDKRIKYQNFGNSNYRSREVGEALSLLDQAKVIRVIHPTTDTELPKLSNNKKSPRLQFLDTGLINHNLGIQIEMLGHYDLQDVYKGALIPHLVTQEFISTNLITDKSPNFWVREKNQSSAEVDLVVPHKNYLIPLEIKSGSVGKLRSLHQFMERAPHPYAVRMYAGEFFVQELKTPAGKPFFLMNLPYYLGTKVRAYLEWFTNEYPV
ncbi:MAG: AAA family ATPase [Bacteroidota bacterium]